MFQNGMDGTVSLLSIFHRERERERERDALVPKNNSRNEKNKGPK